LFLEISNGIKSLPTNIENIVWLKELETSKIKIVRFPFFFFF